MSVTRPPVPIDLLRLRSATTAYLAILADIESFAEQAADVNRIIQPDYAEQLDNLRKELQAGQEALRTGTPASVARRLGELLGEA